MIQQNRRQIETMKQNTPAPEFASSETLADQNPPAGPCTVMQPCADLEPTTKSVPRKSDEPIERGNKNDPQTSTQDAKKP